MTDAELIARLRAEAQSAFCREEDEDQAFFNAAAARIEALSAEVERAERNRDMWKGQCERQTAELEWLRWMLECDAIPTIEDVLEYEEIDPEEGCCALEGFDLCGATPCQSAGCMVDKLNRARAALASHGEG